MTTNLLIFFAIPLAIIIFSIALQKILRNPFLVAGIIFSILLIVVLAFFDTIYLIAVVAYTILSFISAVLTCLICRFFRNQICNGNNGGENLNSSIITVTNTDNLGIGESSYSSCNVGTLGNSTSYNGNKAFSGITGSYAANYNQRR